MAVKVDTQKEIIFGSSEPNISRVLSKKEKDGELRKVAPRIYTTNLVDSLENIVRRNLIDILVYRYPDAIISHRSAKEMRPTATGDFFLTNSTTRRVTDLPGIILNFVKGPKASSHDIPFMGMYISGEHRYMLENVQTSRKSGDESRVLPIRVTENKLEQILLTGGEDRLNEYRDELRTVAEELGMLSEFARINSIISALLSTHDAKVLSTDSAKALAAGNPFDKTRVELFEILFDAIKDRYFVIRNNRNTDEESFRLFSFFESYFSNYIEGTEFDIDEAKAIVDSGIPMPEQDMVWLLNLDMIEQQTGRLLDRLMVPREQIGSSTIGFDADCVLYSKLRPNLNKVLLPDRPGVATSEILPLRVIAKTMSKEYLCWFLRSPAFVTYAQSRTAGAKMPRLGSKALLEARIPVPLPSRQREIVAQLEGLQKIFQLSNSELSRLRQLAKSRFVEAA